MPANLTSMELQNFTFSKANYWISTEPLSEIFSLSFFFNRTARKFGKMGKYWYV